MRHPIPAGFVFHLQLWRVAMRLRAGLELPPAFSARPEAQCALVKSDGVRCPVLLDNYGNHALTCPCAGQFCSRHDLIVQFLARALRRFGCHVKTEQWCCELYDRDKKRHARMDLVVHVDGQVFFFTLTSPLSIAFLVVGKLMRADSSNMLRKRSTAGIARS